MEKKKASIIIPTKDKLTRLRLVLKALEKHVNDSIEVIVVFDGNSKETLEQFEKLQFSYKPVKVILEKNLGRSAARNRGIEKACGDIIIFMDDDMIPGPDFIINHIKCHGKSKVVLGRTRDTYLLESEIEQLFYDKRLTEDVTFLTGNSKVLNKPFFGNLLFTLLGEKNPFSWLSFYTNNVSVNREALNEVGCFDENFKGWGHEDIELGYRLHQHKLGFKRDTRLTNYHLSHQNNHHAKIKESIMNLKYIVKKYNRNFIIKTYFQCVILKEHLIGLMYSLGIVSK